MSLPVAVIVSGFPRRSETFALHELTARHSVVGTHPA